MRTQLLASATLLALAAPAFAQPRPNEEVIVRAPYRGPSRAPNTAPIQDVSLSRDVRFDDLDLRSTWGQDTLRARVRQAAMSVCQDLQTRFPVQDDRGPPCFRTTYADAMAQADDAIRDARLAAR